MLDLEYRQSTIRPSCGDSDRLPMRARRMKWHYGRSQYRAWMRSAAGSKTLGSGRSEIAYARWGVRAAGKSGDGMRCRQDPGSQASPCGTVRHSENLEEMHSSETTACLRAGTRLVSWPLPGVLSHPLLY